MGTKMQMKPALLAATSFLVMACLCNPFALLPSSPEPTPETDHNPLPASVIENDAFTIVQLFSEQGKLKGLLKEQAQLASAQGRQPVVVFDAEW